MDWSGWSRAKQLKSILEIKFCQSFCGLSQRRGYEPATRLRLAGAPGLCSWQAHIGAHSPALDPLGTTHDLPQVVEPG